MKKLVVFLTFIPWLLYFSKITKNVIAEETKGIKRDKKWWQENFFQVFQIDTLILVGIFVFFAKYHKDANQIWLVKVLLFSAINLYLYLNTYHLKYNRSVDKSNISTILLLLIIMFIPIVFYGVTGKYTTTYYILFVYSFFYYAIAMICYKINNLLINNASKNENK